MAERGGKAATMSATGMASKGAFLPAKVVSGAIALTFPRQADVRRKSNGFEDLLKVDYEQPQVINIPDELNPDLPRFLFAAKDERSLISVSQTIIQQNIAFPDDIPLDMEGVTTHVLSQYPLLFNLLGTLKGVRPYFFGMTTTVHVPTHSLYKDYLPLFAHSLLKEPEARGYYDLYVKWTKTKQGLYYDSTTITNYRTYTLQVAPGTIPRVPLDTVTEHGIEITGDFNDRFAFNEKPQYCTGVSKADTIVRNGIRSVEAAIAQVKAMSQ